MADPKPFEGKVITVTGAARGIGFATVRYLLQRGAAVAMSDVMPDSLNQSFQDLKMEFPEAVLTQTIVDVSKREDVDGWIANTMSKFSKIDGCVNNAGVGNGPLCPITEVEDEDFDKVIRINLGGVRNCLRAQLRVVKEGASIVNIASALGITAIPLLAAYTASKHGVVGLTKVAARENADRNIRINAVCPGRVDSVLVQQRIHSEEDRRNVLSTQLFKRLAQPEEIAGMVGFLLGPESTFATGTLYSLDGCWIS